MEEFVNTLMNIALVVIPGIVMYLFMLYSVPIDNGSLSSNTIDKISRYVPCSSADGCIVLHDFDHYYETEKWVDINENIGYYEEIPVSEYKKMLANYNQVKSEYDRVKFAKTKLKSYSENYLIRFLLTFALNIACFKQSSQISHSEGFFVMLSLIISIIASFIIFRFIVIEIIKKDKGVSLHKDLKTFNSESLLRELIDNNSTDKLENTKIASKHLYYFYDKQIDICKLCCNASTCLIIYFIICLTA